MMSNIIDRVGPCRLEARRSGTHYDALVRSIVFQQLSGKAASTIHRRFTELYPGKRPRAEHVVKTEEHLLRGAGLSRQKIGYLRDLSARVADRSLPLAHLGRLKDDEIIEHLVQVKGIGRWTVQMFLMFRLGRPDVLRQDATQAQQQANAQGQKHVGGLLGKMLDMAYAPNLRNP